MLFTKGAFHQRRSNLGSAEPGSMLIIDLNQVQVMIGCTNVKLRSADVVQLNHDFEPWSYVLDADWSDLIEISDIVLTQERPPVANVFIWLFAMFFLVLIL